MLTKLQISVIKVGVYACVRVYTCVCVEGGSGSRSSQMFDISCVLAFAILFMYAEPRYIFTRCILLPIYIYICGEGWGEENGGVDERKRNKGMTVEWHGENTDFELYTHTYIYKFVWISLSFSSIKREGGRNGIDFVRDFKDRKK